MLLWAVFTSGFIIGAILAAHVFYPKNAKREEPVQINAINTDIFNNLSEDKIFDQLTQINYFPQTQKDYQTLIN